MNVKFLLRTQETRTESGREGGAKFAFENHMKPARNIAFQDPHCKIATFIGYIPHAILGVWFNTI